MARTEDGPFLSIDGQPLTISRCLSYLRRSGCLASFLGEIIRQYVIETELSRHPEITVNETLVSFALDDFCSGRKIRNRVELVEWLRVHDDDLASLTDRIHRELRLEYLKHTVTTPELNNYFRDRLPFIEKVALARRVVSNQQEAREIIEGTVLEGCPPTDESKVEEWVSLGETDRAALPGFLKDALASAQVGQLLGPYPTDDQWAIYRFDGAASPSLADPELKQALRDELFERFLGEQMERLQIDLHAAIP